MRGTHSDSLAQFWARLSGPPGARASRGSSQQPPPGPELGIHDSGGRIAGTMGLEAVTMAVHVHQGRSAASVPTMLVVAGAGAYALRRAALRWGATLGESRRELPGDDLVPVPGYCATNATTVQVPPERVWPWLVQMGGYTRAGWYSFDRFDNGGMPSARQIVPELQHLEVGDVMPTDRNGSGFTVERIDPPHALVLTIREQDSVTSSALVLRRQGTATRLLCRLRLTAPLTPAGVRYRLIMELGHVPMTLVMLRGIRRRAERLG